MAAVVAIAAAPAGAAVEIRPEPRDLSFPLAGELVVVGAGGAEPVFRSLQEVVAIATPLPFTVTCRGERLWCPEIEIEAGEEAATLPVYPAIEVTARLAGPGAGAGLRSGSVQGVVRDEAAPGEPLELRHELAVEDGKILFRAPRAPIDLRFAFPGAAPVYRWSLEAEGSASVLELGTLTLQPGASASGWLVSEEADVPVVGATVKATRLGDRDSGEAALRVI